jgi:hypothetical protein
MPNYVYRKDEPTSALDLVRQGSPVAESGQFNIGRLVVLLVLGSGVFVVIRTYMSPSVPAWLIPDHPVDPDNVGTMLMVLSIFEWLTLIAVTVLPLSAIAVFVDRMWLERRLASARPHAARRVYEAIALAGLVASVPLWSVAWDRVVLPFENSVPGAIVLVLLIGAFGLYALKSDRKSE